MQPGTSLLARPLRSLTGLFVCWKLLLLVVASASPGQGYDTSSSFVSREPHGEKELPLALSFIVDKLTRWDAIYFVGTSHRGYVFEQEWAFGWGFTQLIAICTAGLQQVLPFEALEGLSAVCIAHLAHLLSVLVLFKLSLALFGDASSLFAFTTALVHIISPAGLFLSAPYAESSCALLSFTGCFLFSKSFSGSGSRTAWHDALVLLSGVVFGIAATFRSNAILNGLLLLEEAFRILWEVRHGGLGAMRRLLATGVGGLIIAGGFLLPQTIAYSRYCTETEVVLRPWCTRTVPSIYAFVQDHYWNMGLFRYWTISNLPLFLLAAPMYVLMAKSCMWVFNPKENSILTVGGQKAETAKDTEIARGSGKAQILRNMAASQLALILLTTTTAHVQIITRISSSYPVWMWYTAHLASQRRSPWFGYIVSYAAMYAIIQGGLFASFLPPA